MQSTVTLLLATTVNAIPIQKGLNVISELNISFSNDFKLNSEAT